MDFRIKGMSYGLLLSHTLPGLLFGLEMLLVFQLFTKFRIIDFLYSIENNTGNLIIGLVVVFVLATLLGFMVDGIHHLLEEFIWKRIKKTNFDEADLYRVIKTNTQIQIYKQVLEDIWFPYEAYANLGLAMLPGIILLPIWLYRLNVHCLFNFALTIIYIFIFWAMCHEACSTARFYKEAEHGIIENFKDE